MKRYVSDFLFAVLAGVSIALGGTVFLSLDNKVLGALFFCVGLFTVCTFGFHLFTGKVCYALEKPPAYCGWLVLVWFGNLAGANLVGYLLRATRLGPALAEKAAALCQAKTSDSLLSIFLLAMFCNLLIFLAVDGFQRNPHELGKYLGLFSA